MCAVTLRQMIDRAQNVSVQIDDASNMEYIKLSEHGVDVIQRGR